MGQHFPVPLWEKNGTRDAFRYYLHLATGGSDHICFNNPMVGVPGIELNIWPDQWYHADTDTPDKSDPTQMRRTAFIGAAMALAAVDCTDETLVGLLQVVSDYGYERVGKRELPQALKLVEKATVKNLQSTVEKGVHLIRMATGRESEAIESIREIFSGSAQSVEMLEGKLKQWSAYQDKLVTQILDYGQIVSSHLNIDPPWLPKLTPEELAYEGIIPSIHADLRGKEFNLERSKTYRDYVKNYPDTVKRLGLNRIQKRSILNFINGKRSILKIRGCVQGDTRQDLKLDRLVRYLDILKGMGWITY